MHTGHEDPGIPGNGGSTAKERGELDMQLRQEQQERQDFVAALTERDERIDELTVLLERSRDAMVTKQEEYDHAWAEMAALKQTKDEAVDACRDALRMAHPELPGDLIEGETVEELAASVQGARSLVEKVRTALSAEKTAARVPAGAPVSNGPDLAGLSPRDKISAGIQTRSR